MNEVYRSHVSSWLEPEALVGPGSFRFRDSRKLRAGMNHYVLFPFKGGALALWVIFTVGFDLAFHAGLMGIPLALALTSWFFKYCFVLLDSIVTGADEPPVLSVEMVNPLDEQRPLGQALLITGGVFLTLAVSHSAGVVLGWLCGALLLALLPASIATMGLTSNLVRAAWPPDLWSVVRGIGQRDYLILISAIPGLAAVLDMLLHFGAPWLVLLALTQVSLLLTFALVGSALHEHRLALGIEYRTKKERIAERDEREHESERNRVLDHAYMKFRVGKPQEGWQEIQTWLDSRRAGVDPTDRILAEHRAMLAITDRWDDVRAADKLTNDLVELYFARRETGRALQVVEERVASNPNFRPKNEAHAVRLAELAAVAGKRTLRRQLMPPDQDTGPASP
jgi:hypothetical protein